MRYFCFITEEGLYVGIDDSSGGYPYTTNIPTSIYLWRSKEEALKYKSHFPKENWILKEFLGLSLKDVTLQ